MSKSPPPPPPPPPPPASASGTHAEVAGRSSGTPASKSAAGKKPWSKPAVLVVEDGVFLTESGPDPEFLGESVLYYPSS